MSSNIVLEESRRPVAEPAGEANRPPRLPHRRRSRRPLLRHCSGLSRSIAISLRPRRWPQRQAAITEVTLKDAQKLPAGSVLMFKFGTAPAMLIHHADNTWVALTAVCTHLGCTVQYEPQANRIHCACHGGVYDPRTGANVSGPPPKPLKLFKVAVSETGVEVSRA